MPSLLIRNIRKLAGIESAPSGPRRGADLAILPAIRNAFLLVENGKIARFGPMSECPDRADEVVEADGRYVLPAWCDSHTHLVFAGTREREFVD
ncbi:MAG: imidazolonepropionase, partial [Bacteroidetes bacterium]